MVMGRLHVGTERHRRGVIPMNAADSVAELNNRGSVMRPYVRSGAQKLRWTRGLHHAFTRAVEELGGGHRATPTRILELMGEDGVTVAHVKSHLQMYRIGKVNLEGMPDDPKLGATGDLTPQEQREVYIALQLLKAGRISGPALAHNVAEVHRFEALTPAAKGKKKKLEDHVETHEFISGLGSLNERKRKRRDEDGDDHVELDLAVGSRLSSLKPSPGTAISLQLPSPSTPEEATLSLGLSVSR